jgi:3-isopropylmalate/(R)-2-methylmalate dehydratase small subunit
MKINHEKLRGFVWKFGNNVDTDQIMPSRYCNTFLPDALGPHAMEGAAPDFAKQVAPGDIIVAGRNFGCGSSREAAPIAIKAAGISAVVAHSFARIFYRNAVNIGLLVLVSPAASESLVQGEDVEIEPGAGILHSLSSGRVYRCDAPSGLMKEVLHAGGLVGYVKHRLEKGNGQNG